MIEPIVKVKKRIANPLLSQLPPLVAKKVKELAEDYSIKSATLLTYPERWKMHAGEGERFVVFLGEEMQSVEMVHSNTVGAAGLCYDIGSTAVPPAGAWIIRIHYYTRYWMDIVNIVHKELISSNGTPIT